MEIGTGTGYNVALLCERLAANGHTPTLAVANGHTGYPPGAPYDWIIATCAVPAIPPAWLKQAAPSAVILTDVHGPLGGTLARLTVDEHGTTTGRFLQHWVGFMTLCHDVEPTERRWPVLALAATRSWTTTDPRTVNTHGLFGFILQWQLPKVTHGRMTDDDGQPAVLLLARDGSRAEVLTTATACGYPRTSVRPATAVGPRRGRCGLLERAGPVILRTFRHHRHTTRPTCLVRPARRTTPLVTTPSSTRRMTM